MATNKKQAFKKQALQNAGAHYIKGMGWYFNASTKWEVEEDDSSARFLGANVDDAYNEMREMDAQAEAQVK